MAAADGDDAEDPGDGQAPVAEAMHVAHDRGERGVVDAGEGGSLDERAERVRAVDDPGAQHRDERGEMGGEVHHASRSGPAPRGGSAPICWNISSRFSSSQCSTNMPSSTRQMSMERISTGLPLAGMPMNVAGVGAAVDEAAHHAVTGDHQVLHGGAQIGQCGEERGPELAVRLAAVGDEGVVVAVVLGHEPVHQIRLVRVEHREVGLGEVLSVGIHVELPSKA